MWSAADSFDKVNSINDQTTRRERGKYPTKEKLQILNQNSTFPVEC
jgi:hypothetical protein